MGLLTDPRAENVWVLKFVLRWERSLCYLMYIVGIVYLALLALPAFNEATYFSENALLPGLVTKESRLDRTAKQYHSELLTEMERITDQMPYSWIAAKMNQMNLDVYIHNFTLNYPFKNQKFKGQNIYGIVRASSAASTEAIVISVPFRPQSSVHPTTAPSIALLLAFAKFCRQQKYWAKDLIFLVTEYEQLGMQAWLDAYHGVVGGRGGVMDAGDLEGRSGSIQAAINLELHAMKIAYIDVKVEGLNGQLPNLDLFNLAQTMIKKEGIKGSFQGRFDMNYRKMWTSWAYHFHTMMSMVFTQATGVPSGNHGLFHRYGIEAITLEGFEKTKTGYEVNFDRVGRTLESIVRSLNNLLERFHQSFFFYLLPSTDRYISIGLYMPGLVLIIGGLFIKAFSTWLKLQDSKPQPDEKDTKPDNFDVGNIASEFLWSHIFGVAVMASPKLLTWLGTASMGFHTETSIYVGFLVITLFTIKCYRYIPRTTSRNSSSLICVIAVVELATTLMCIAMHNLSLAFLAGAIYVPIVLLVTPPEEESSKLNKILPFFWFLLHPFVITSIIVTCCTFVHFAGEPFMTKITSSFDATQKFFVFSIIDSMIYGNWLFNVATTILLPIWLLLSNVITGSTKTSSSKCLKLS